VRLSVDLRVEEIIDKPYDLVLKALLEDSDRWLPSLARTAGNRLQTDLAVQVGKARVGRAAEVNVQPPTIYPDRCEIAIAWKAAEMTALFPELSGGFQLVAAGPRASRLSFKASYEPPGRALGRLADQALMPRIAESSVKDFVRRTAHTLGDRATAPDIGT
jgi:ribosome-associated toxin RatA of RatAB toxin-antitoxin module